MGYFWEDCRGPDNSETNRFDLSWCRRWTRRKRHHSSGRTGTHVDGPSTNDSSRENVAQRTSVRGHGYASLVLVEVFGGGGSRPEGRRQVRHSHSSVVAGQEWNRIYSWFGDPGKCVCRSVGTTGVFQVPVETRHRQIQRRLHDPQAGGGKLVQNNQSRDVWSTRPRAPSTEDGE